MKSLLATLAILLCGQMTLAAAINCRTKSGESLRLYRNSERKSLKFKGDDGSVFACIQAQGKTPRAASQKQTPLSDDEIINKLYSPYDYQKVGRVVGRNYSLCCKRYGSGATANVYCHPCN